MKKKLFLSSILLIALPEFCQDKEFRVMPSLLASSFDSKEDVDIVLLNCPTKQDIIPYLRKCLREWYSHPEDEIQSRNASVIQLYLEMINSRTYEHPVPKALLDAVTKCANKKLEREQMYYLSSVS